MSSPNPYAWPKGWQNDPRFINLRSSLVFHYGEERARNIVLGLDEATNADLEAWRRLGRPHGPAVAL